MGVAQIWDLIRECQPNPVLRYPISVALPGKRIAIDAYHILFECGFFNRSGKVDDISKPILNLIHRLKELIALDIWFLLIFDGNDKPTKIRRVGTNEDGSKKDALNLNFGIDIINDPIMRTICELLNRMNISWVTTTGEGEAFCCYLQDKLHVVDCIWSNDSDCFIFGGTKVLKNYSRQFDDVGVTSEYNKYFDKQKNNYITFVDYDDLVCNHDMLNRDQLLLYSILLGADYNTGVKGLGKIKSLGIVKHKKPDFSRNFYDIFNNITIENKEQKQTQYEKFQKDIYTYCQKHSKALFGRNYGESLLSKNKDNFENWPSIDVVLHYFHPSILQTFNKEPLNNKYANIHGSRGYDKVDFTKLKITLADMEFGNVTNFDRWFHSTMHEMFLIKYINYSNDNEVLRKNIIITEEKTEFINNLNRNLSHWKIRYKSFLHGVVYDKNEDSPTKSRRGSPHRSHSTSPSKSPIRSPNKSSVHSPNKSPNRSPSKRQLYIMEFPFSLWVDKTSIPDDNILVLDFRAREAQKAVEEERKKQEKSKRVSPKKRLGLYKQSTTLDSFFKKGSAHTIVKTNISDDVNTAENNMQQLNVVRKKLFVEDNKPVLDKPPVLERKESNSSVKRKQDDHETDDTDDESLIILGELSARPVTPEQDTVYKESPTKKHKINFKTIPLVTRSTETKPEQQTNKGSKISHPAIKCDMIDELFNPNKRSPSISREPPSRTPTPEKRISTSTNTMHPQINYDMVGDLFNQSSCATTIYNPTIPTPRKPPYLARADTFGTSDLRRNILDDINNDVEQVVREVNDMDSDSTLATLSDDETPVNNRFRDDSEDPFNESDDILLDL
ncbi:hypothetical protein C6P45_003017 [Maudiozyma exigua]|uniref:XPG-I domain-containing protein n=1 Tax=Maudiozyma exigua TaxID=34358 RepID=A0A9P7BDP1_MAUEX|nr:hypothetical protein C6P45_003017 [Kazachstania exigua]